MLGTFIDGDVQQSLDGCLIGLGLGAYADTEIQQRCSNVIPQLNTVGLVDVY